MACETCGTNLNPYAYRRKANKPVLGEEGMVLLELVGDCPSLQAGSVTEANYQFSFTGNNYVDVRDAPDLLLKKDESEVYCLNISADNEDESLVNQVKANTPGRYGSS